MGDDKFDRLHGAVYVTKKVTLSSLDARPMVQDRAHGSSHICVMNILTPRTPQLREFQSKPPQHETIGQRIHMLRDMRKQSQEELASILDVSRETIGRWEADDRAPKERLMSSIAQHYGVSAEWIRYGATGGPKTLPVMGYVGAGSGVRPFDDGPFEQIETPFGTPPDTIALIVRGDSMMPELSDGDYVLYRAIPQNAEDCVGRRCIVELLDGTVLVKRLRRGRDFNCYDLDSTNAAPIENQRLQWVAKVEAVKYR
jgi:phage repressor protein C with HTH and peptisase S24 domain